MKAMILKKTTPVEEKPLEMEDLPIPQPGPKQIRVKISTCGLCHTELDEIEGRLPPRLPIILGHEIVGKVESLGSEVTKFRLGERVGIGWINSAGGKCHFAGREMKIYARSFTAPAAMQMEATPSTPWSQRIMLIRFLIDFPTQKQLLFCVLEQSATEL